MYNYGVNVHKYDINLRLYRRFLLRIYNTKKEKRKI